MEIANPGKRGRAVAALFFRVAAELYRDLVESGLLPAGDARAEERAQREWECFALYACVRGLVAQGGFNPLTAMAVDAFHQAVEEEWTGRGAPGEELATRKATLSQRYAEYGELGQKESRAGDPQVARKLGWAAARHMADPAEPDPALAEVVSTLHESLVEAVMAALPKEA